jgi:hypothetical protein
MSALGVRAVIEFSFDSENKIFCGVVVNAVLFPRGANERCDRRSI